MKGIDLYKEVRQGMHEGKTFRSDVWGVYRVGIGIYDRLNLWDAVTAHNLFTNRTPQDINLILDADWEEVPIEYTFTELLDIIDNDGNLYAITVVRDGKELFTGSGFFSTLGRMEEICDEGRELAKMYKECRFILK